MKRVGECAWLLPLDTPEGVLAALSRLSRDAPAAVRDLVPGASTVLVAFHDPPEDAEERWLAAAWQDVAGAQLAASSADARSHAVPVRYDGEDLALLARHAGLSVADAIALHAGASYRVAFVGFQPGFAYLAGLPDALRMPRRASPRPRVPAGSVAIGGEWTGIYPAASPGGWHLLGHTDVALFDPNAERPALLQPGDVVRMVPA
ncbi:MAG TPA: 5-oxoprolinase subunit PxpB [Candidatus Binatia bacterium]|nr:5-oxoprolinase subunit PxpB [Candidatus Binatia bacterium]